MPTRFDPPSLESVDAGSRAAAAGLKAGDRLMRINGHPIRDLIDFRFHSADSELECLFERGKKSLAVRIPGGDVDGFGLRFAPMRFCGCGNQCAFCFVDQNPGGLRPSLYFKDEDYRLSFLFGNYVTLTRVGEEDLSRIVEQRLSPLYVSVHATDAAVRRRLLGLRRDDGLLEKMRALAERGIAMHAQIVLCPGWNDGAVLLDSIETLRGLYPALRSLAVVPVGLTRHRKGLPPLAAVDRIAAIRTLDSIRPLQKRFLSRSGEAFVYCADEFYLLAHRPIPAASHYGDFWQEDNGVGMVRSFLTRFGGEKRRLPKSFVPRTRFLIVTGTLAAPFLRERVLPVLNRIRNAAFRLVPVRNRFYGESVTVSGLLTGRDIAAALASQTGGRVVLIPSNCLNADGRMLDDWTVERLSRRLNRKCIALESFDRLREAA